jgi:sugar lactone lactonase YvrE
MKRTAFVLVVLTIFFGCATAPPEREIETVFYPPLPQQPRLQFLYSITSEDDIGSKQSAFDEFLFGKVQPKIKIVKPYDIGSSDGKIYILDRTVRKILIIDLANRKIDYFKDRRLGKLNDPSGFWITADDIKYVADMKRKQIVAFDKDDKFLKAYGGKDLFDRPVDVAVYGNTLYVCDMNKHQVFALDKSTGKPMWTIGKLGTKEGFFYKPTHVIVDHVGNIFVNDAFNFRVQKFDPKGNFIKSFGFHGDALGAFARPKGLAIDREGHLYVADAAFENVQIFDDRTGQLLLFFGGAGAAPGSMYLPAGVHIDYTNVQYFAKFADKDFRLKYIFYVVNSFGGNKLNVYGFGEWVGPSLTGKAEEKLEKAEDLEKVEKLDKVEKLEKTEDLEEIERVEQGSDSKKAD